MKIKKPIQVYSNRDRWVDQDQAISFLSSDRYVAIDFHMLQSIWVSNNTDIAVHLTIQNNNTHYVKKRNTRKHFIYLIDKSSQTEATKTDRETY